MACDAFNDLIAEAQSSFWIIFESQSLFQEPCKKSSITGWLLLWV